MDIILAFIILAVLIFFTFNKKRNRKLYRGNSSRKNKTKYLKASKRQLLKELQNDPRRMNRIINSLKLRHPNPPAIWYVDKALFDLRRDRGY